MTGEKPPGGDRPDSGKGTESGTRAGDGRRSDPLLTEERLEEVRRVIQDWTAKVVGSLERVVAELRTEAGEVRQSSGELARSLASWLSRSLEAARATPQAGRLGRELAAVYGAYRWLEVRVRSMEPDEARAEREGWEDRSAARLAAALGDLRRPVLRIAELAGARRDVLPPGWIAALGLVRGPVPPIDAAAVASHVRDELGAAFDERVASIEEQPLVARELFQVHGAELRDGARVALKVPVPGIAGLVEGGLSLLNLLASAPGIRPSGLDLRPAAADVARAIREELDFELEAERLRQMAADLAGDPEVRVARVLGDLSTFGLLTTERIDGEPVADFLARAASEGDAAARTSGEGDAAGRTGGKGDAAARTSGEGDTAGRTGGKGDAADRDRTLAALVRTVMTQALTLGRVHPDPAAAFLVEPDGRLALVDVGSLVVLTDDARRAAAAATAAFLDRDRDRLAAALVDLGLRPHDAASRDPRPQSDPADRGTPQADAPDPNQRSPAGATGQRSAEVTADTGQPSPADAASRSQRSADDSAPQPLVELADRLLDAFGRAPAPPAPDLDADAPPDRDPRAALDSLLDFARDRRIAIPHHAIQLARALTSLAALFRAHEPSLDLAQLLAPYRPPH